MVGKDRIADRGTGLAGPGVVDEAADAQQGEHPLVDGIAASDLAQAVARAIIKAFVKHPGYVVPAGGVIEDFAQRGEERGQRSNEGVYDLLFVGVCKQASDEEWIAQPIRVLNAQSL